MPRPAPRIPRNVLVGKRQPNEKLRPKHIAFVKTLPCISCGAPGPNEAAHVRMSVAEHGKYNTMSRKPDDKFVVPLCHKCHIGDQHTKYAEPEFWARLGIDPIDACLRLWAITGDYDQGLRTIERARQSIALHKRARLDMSEGQNDDPR